MASRLLFTQRLSRETGTVVTWPALAFRVARRGNLASLFGMAHLKAVFINLGQQIKQAEPRHFGS
ncbi:MAG: hypothetical protein ACPHP8_05905, partial [Luminiphilus sp.]